MVCFIKTDGCRIWVVIKNFTGQPKQITPRMDLVACRASVECYSFLDEGIRWIPNKRVIGEKVLVSSEEKDGHAWKNIFFSCSAQH